MKRIFGKFLAILGVVLLLFTAWGAWPAHTVLAFAPHGYGNFPTADAAQPLPLPVSSEFCSCELYGIWGSGASDVYAVGYSYVTAGPYLPLVYHYDGSSWSAANLPLPDGWAHGWLYKVWGSGARDVYAAGRGTGTTGPYLPLLYHYSGNAWSEVSLSLPDGVEGQFMSVWGSGASDVYAGGFGWNQGELLGRTFPIFYHFDGSDWTSVSLPLPSGSQRGNVAGVWGSGADNVYAAVTVTNADWRDMPVIYRYDGSVWNQVSLPLPDGWYGTENIALSGVWGSEANDVYAAAYDGSSPLLYHYGGSNWTATVPALLSGWDGGELHAVWGSGASDVYAAGFWTSMYATGMFPLLYHYGGGDWTPVSLPLPDGWRGGLEGVWASTANDVYAVGNSWDSNGRKMPLIYHLAGSGWTFSLPWPTPTFSATPASWSFGWVKVGTTCGMLDVGKSSACKVFQVQNTGPGDLTFSSNVSLTGKNPGQFQILDAGCLPTTVLQQTGTCTVIVAFRPTSAGSKTALLRFPDNAAGSPHAIALSGTAGAELAYNGGFNTYPSSTAKIPITWLAASFASTDGKDTTYKMEGAASIKIVGQSGKTKTLTQTRLINGSAGNTFLLSLWRKGANIPATAGAVQAQVSFFNGNTWKQTVVMPLPTGTYSFTRQTKTFTASYAYTQISIKLIYSKATGAAWFDGLSLLRSP